MTDFCSSSFAPALIATLFVLGSANANAVDLVEKNVPSIDAVLVNPSSQATISGNIPIQLNLASPEGYRRPDEELRIVKKIHKQQDVGLMLLGAVMGAFRMPNSKEYYSGTSVDEVNHPAEKLFIPAISKLVDAWISENPPAAKPYENPMRIRPDVIALIYENFDDENPKYDFHLQTSISRAPDSRSFFSWAPPPQVTCTDQFSDPPLDLNQWQANDYAELRQRIRQHVENCLPKIKTGLPLMLAA